MELKYYDHEKTVFITILSVKFKPAADLKQVSYMQCQRFCSVVRLTHSDTLPPNVNLSLCLTFRHRESCILGQAFHYCPENAFYVFNQPIYFII